MPKLVLPPSLAVSRLSWIARLGAPKRKTGAPNMASQWERRPLFYLNLTAEGWREAIVSYQTTTQCASGVGLTTWKRLWGKRTHTNFECLLFSRGKHYYFGLLSLKSMCLPQGRFPGERHRAGQRGGGITPKNPFLPYNREIPHLLTRSKNLLTGKRKQSPLA